MNQLKEDLIWIALGIPGMVLIGLVLHISFISNGRFLLSPRLIPRNAFNWYFVLALLQGGYMMASYFQR